jgi:hypothetical protein
MSGQRKESVDNSEEQASRVGEKNKRLNQEGEQPRADDQKTTQDQARKQTTGGTKP